MAAIPGYCTHCGHIFEGLGGIHIENSFGVTLSGNRMTCPKCGKLARLVDGTFNARVGKLELVAGPPITSAVLEQLYGIFKRTKQGTLTPQQAVTEATEINPAMGKLMAEYLSVGPTTLTALLSLVALYYAHVQTDLQRQNNDLARESLELQKLDSQASGDFYKDALDVLEQQRVLLEQQTVEHLHIPDHLDLDADEESHREAPHTQQAQEKPAPQTTPSKRRAKVNKARREALKERRRMFQRCKPRDVN